MPPVACAHGFGTRFRLGPSEEAFKGRETIPRPAHTRGVLMSFGRGPISAKTAGNRRGRLTGLLMGWLASLWTRKEWATVGTDATTHTGDTDSPTEQSPAFRALVEEGL